VSSACYTATWEVVYFQLDPDFTTGYQARLIEKDRARGATPAELASRKAALEKFAKLYQNPVINSAITFLEPLPVGLVVR
jgi:hypothetical protein